MDPLKMILIQLIASCVVILSFAHANNILDYETFKVKTTIHYVESDNDFMAFTIEEKYSFEQSRAIIGFSRHYDTKLLTRYEKKPFLKAGTFFLDSLRNLSVLMTNDLYNCYRMEVGEFLRYLDLEFLSESIDLGTQSHIVGPAKILHHIMNNKQALRLINFDIDASMSERRNVKSVDYSLSIAAKNNTKFGDKIELLVSFDKLSFAKENENAIPHYVELNWNGPERRRLIMQFSPLVTLRASTIYDQQREARQPIIYDQFILPPLKDCYRFLGDKRKSLFEQMSSRRSGVRFSFRAEVELPETSSQLAPSGPSERVERYQKLVAYDSRLNMMRVDIGKAESTIENFKEIFNFQKNRLYTILDKGDFGRSDMERHLRNQDESPVIGNDMIGQCVTSRIQDIGDGQKELYSLDELLVGSNQFIAIGRANVRGIDCMVFESVNKQGRPPYWLDQPVDYKDWKEQRWASDRKHTRRPYLDELDFASELTTLVYVAEYQMQTQVQIVAMELLQESGSGQFRQQTIMIHDFIWDLADNRPYGEAVNDLFSVHDECAVQEATRSPDEHHNVRLLLETEDIDNWKLLKRNLLSNVNERNFAILAELQNSLRFSANLMYDLRSQLIEPSEAHAEQPASGVQAKPNAYISVEFRTAPESKIFVGLEYVGRGTRRMGSSLLFTTHSFLACYQLAAHKKRNLYFGYYPSQGACIVDQSEYNTTGDDEVPKSPGFEIDISEAASGYNRQLEIYRTRHIVRELETKPDRWLHKDAYQGEKIHLMNKKLTLTGLSGIENSFAPVGLEFRIKRLIAHGFKPTKVSPISGGHDPAATVSLIEGYGFDVSDTDNFKLLKRAPVHKFHMFNPSSDNIGGGEYQGAQMNLEQCQAACAASLDCQSYSVCVRGFDVQCALSNVSFRLSQVVDRLIDASQSKSNRGPTKFTLEMGVRRHKVKLVKHANCAIHNKRYMDFFKSPYPVSTSLYGYKLLKVQEMEKCASICSRENMIAMKAHMDQLADLLGRLSGRPMSLEQADLNTTSLDDVSRQSNGSRGESIKLLTRRELNQSLLEKICFRFFFISFLSLEDEDDQVVAKVKEYASELEEAEADSKAADSDESVATIGYCAMPVKLNEVASFRGIDSIELHVDQYNFKMETFYEQTYGVSLKGSSLSEEETEAMATVSFSGSSRLSEQSMNVLSSFIRRGDNSQIIYPMADKSICATLCLMQSIGPWPSCKSFDIVMEKDETKENKTTMVCRLNSVTMAQVVSAKRSDLIDGDEEASRAGSSHSRGERWHFDPRPGFVQESSWYEASVEYALARDSCEANNDSLVSRLIKWILKSLLVLGCALIGLLIGVRSARPLVGRLGLVGRRDSLVTSQVGLLGLPDNIVELDERAS